MADAIAERLKVLEDNQALPPEAVARFAKRLREGDDRDLYRMNPMSFAREAKISDGVAIDLFLHATQAGLVEFTWGLICPACGSFLTTPAALRSLESKSCALCEVTVPVTDRSIEVAFTVSPRARRIRFHPPQQLDLRQDWPSLFFSSSHIPAPGVQAALSELLIGTVTLPVGISTIERELLEVGRFAISAPAQHLWLRIEVQADASQTSAEVDIVQGRFLPAEVKVRPGRVRLTVNNRLSEPISAAWLKSPVPPVELRTPGDMPMGSRRPYLDGKALVMSQTFRELFRAESIPSEGGLELKDVTMLFTDLKSSTELYERIGDLRAYELVRQHFDLLKQIIRTERGALVKTIGDAVMASFAEPAHALSAAAAMNKEIRSVGKGELELKIGLHAGPCIAVESNERLDYFGRTVNIAARAQGTAEANQIVITESVYQPEEAQAVIRSSGLSAREDRALFKGLDAEMKVYRLS